MKIKSLKTGLAVIIFTCSLFAGNSFATEKDTATKTVAILPFSVFIDTSRLLNGVSVESLIRAAEISRYRYQQSLYIWFLRKPGRYNVVFQNLMTTRELLAKARWGDSLKLKTSEQLCLLLGVDAVISGEVYMKKPRAQETATLVNGITGLPLAASNKIHVGLTLHDDTGKLRWRQDQDVRGDISAENMIDNIMRYMAKTFPFKK
ncbi:MAG: hypothetical protein WKF85_14750 [Chitinophagaceae bacterium]